MFQFIQLHHGDQNSTIVQRTDNLCSFDTRRPFSLPLRIVFMMRFLKKNYGNLLMLAVIALILIPATGTPIKVLVNRLVSFSPSAIDLEDRTVVETFEWQLVDMNGEVVNLAQSKGKVILVNSWATWCPPCIAEMPELQALFDDYSDRMDFYFVSNEPGQTQQAFLRKKGYDLPIYRPSGPAPEALRSNSLPTTWLLDREGRIVIQKTGAAKWNSANTRKLIDGLLP